MNLPDEKYVYHGSKDTFENVIPKRNIRTREEKDGSVKVIFDDVSFHATPYRWIALAYTYDPKGYEIGGKMAHYGMGVSLYDHGEKIDIYGFHSLKQSLEKLYGDGGYLYIFEKEKFFRTEGLGDLEVITKENIKPFKIEKIDNPLAVLKNLGIGFNFIDLAKPENEEFRNYL